MSDINPTIDRLIGSLEKFADRIDGVDAHVRQMGMEVTEVKTMTQQLIKGDVLGRVTKLEANTGDFSKERVLQRIRSLETSLRIQWFLLGSLVTMGLVALIRSLFGIAP